jgi:hypothetical protein
MYSGALFGDFLIRSVRDLVKFVLIIIDYAHFIQFPN